MKTQLIQKIGILLSTAFALLLPNIAMASDANELGFAFGFSCPIDAEKCIPEDVPETKTAFVIGNPELGKPLDLDLKVRNPRGEMITSARAKLKYDPAKIEVLRISTDDSDFPLFAPGEKDIDREEGTIKLGGSFTSGSKSEEEFLFVKITVRPKALGAKLEFLNFQKTELGDTGILYTHGIDTENRLPQLPKPLLFGAESKNNSRPKIQDFIATEVTPDETSSNPVSTCERPSGLRVQTDSSGKVYLLWPLPDQQCVSGYFTYYGQKSGMYLRRRDVGKTNFVEIKNLEKDKRYCFAITSYDALNTETDYSDEVCAVIGQPGTETSGFLGDPRNISSESSSSTTPPKSVGSGNITTRSGPAESVFFLLLVSAGLTLVGFAFRSRRS